MTKKTLRVYCDGGARGNPGPAASAFIVVLPDGKILVKKGVFIGETTNNIAEYKAVLFALEWLLDLRYSGEVIFFLDSQLVVNQMTGKFKIKNKNLLSIASKIKSLEKKFRGKIFYKNIPREQNKITDLLVNKTLNTAGK